jgi:hypothetical protein
MSEAQRERLPQRRAVEQVEIAWQGFGFVVGLGWKEVFISSRAKTGSPVDVAARDIAILMSLALQYGCPVDVMERALTKGADGNPEGLAGEVARLM